MQLVQVTLTDELAGLLAAAAGITISAHEQGHVVTLNDDELTEYQRLATFFTAVASEPHRFPVRESMARSIKKKARELRGPAQPQSKKQKKHSQGQQKRDRQQRRADVAKFNADRERMEQEAQERETFLTKRRIEMESEPKFDITDIMGNVILRDVPQSMVKAQDEPGTVTASEVERVLQLPAGVRVDE